MKGRYVLTALLGPTEQERNAEREHLLRETRPLSLVSRVWLLIEAEHVGKKGVEYNSRDLALPGVLNFSQITGATNSVRDRAV